MLRRSKFSGEYVPIAHCPLLTTSEACVSEANSGQHLFALSLETMFLHGSGSVHANQRHTYSKAHGEMIALFLCSGSPQASRTNDSRSGLVRRGASRPIPLRLCSLCVLAKLC